MHPSPDAAPSWLALHRRDTVYVWVPFLVRFVYHRALTIELGRPRPVVTLEPITARAAAAVIDQGRVGRRDPVIFRRVLRDLEWETRTIGRAETPARAAESA